VSFRANPETQSKGGEESRLRSLAPSTGAGSQPRAGMIEKISDIQRDSKKAARGLLYRWLSKSLSDSPTFRRDAASASIGARLNT